MEITQRNKEEIRTIPNQISIDDYLETLRKEWQSNDRRNKLLNPPIPISYDQFCQLIIAHGSNFLVKRGEEIPFKIDRNNEYVISEIYKYLKRDKLFKGYLSKGILLNGSYGCGKTVLMNAVCKTYNYCTSLWNNPNIREMRVVKSSTIVDSFRKEKNEIELSNYKAGILIIDELGREQKEVNVYGTIIQPISYLIQERYDRGVPTFAISNFTSATLSSKDYYGKMVGDRLRQMFNELTLNGESRRT